MKANLSRNTTWILQAFQIVVLPTAVKSLEENHLNSAVRLAQNIGISPTVMEFCWLHSPGDTRGLITAVQEGFPCVFVLFYIWPSLNIYSFLFETSGFILLCEELIAVAMAFWLAFAATAISMACGDAIKWDQHDVYVQPVFIGLVRTAQYPCHAITLLLALENSI